MAEPFSITLTAPGPREVVKETRAKEIIDQWTQELLSATESHSEIIVEKIILTNKSYTSEAAQLLASFFTSENLEYPFPQPLASSVKILDASDIIASRMEAEGLQVLQTICDAFEQSELIEVDLSDNAMGSKGVSACASVLSGQASSLERLLLCNNGLSEASMSEVADILCSNQMGSRLTKLHFYNNMSGNGGCLAFARIIATCSESLQNVRFSGTRAGREGSLHIATALEKLDTNIMNLKYLDLADNTFGTKGGYILAKALRRCVHLEELNVRDCVLEDDATVQISKALWASDAPLVKLDVSGNEITKKGAKAIGDLVEGCPALKIFHGEENEMSSKGIEYIASAFGSNIEEIRLGFNECGSRAAYALMTAHGEKGEGLPNLKKIYLDGNMFTEDDVEALTQAFGDSLEEMEDNIEDGDADDELSESEDEGDEVDELADAMGKTNIAE